MSNPSLVAASQRFAALLEMVEDDGASPPGQMPPTEYVAALRDAPLGRSGEVAEAHRNNAGPPEFAGAGGGSA